MTLYQIKPRFQGLLRPLLRRLHRAGVSANQITLAALALSVIAGGVLMVLKTPLAFAILPGVLFIRMALNALDGMMAREYHQQTRLGAILNELGDVLSDVALYLPFLFLPGSHPALVLTFLFFTVLSEFCGVLAQSINGVRSYAGPLGKSDRALAFGAWGLAIAIWPQLLAWNNLVWGAAMLLLVWTLINRCRSVLREQAS
ncbi:CDP-alcohol phosphatidyltransferase family protein [Superficieibacter sp.]|uniref:CDP-alcohol phosphatidyltransferase family protein n=1 Tax=Superficieibacter sp. TaxID=2303322 RepID=UPI0028A6CA2A|nr:CDP-alcohol phosphatidyltransferase family protein [Superficieibacter sp.]